MTKLPEPMEKVIDALARLPGIGPRQATRLAFYLVGRGAQYDKQLSDAVGALQTVKLCERCYFVHQNADSLCDICRNPQRRQDVIMIIEKETDLLSLEKPGKYDGRYLILGGVSKTGILESWQTVRLQKLKNFIRDTFNGKAKEIILAFNPTNVGDFSASLLAKELEPFTESITRLGRGLPTGGEIEFADEDTLGSALARRG